MEQNKYYTPTIEEFHIGFSFEVMRRDGVFEKSIFSNAWSTRDDWMPELSVAIKEKYLRVKCLDREDIESLEWRFFGCPLKEDGTRDFPIVYQILGKKEPMRNSSILATLVLIRENVYNIIKAIENGEPVMEFKGYIKNKSELKKIMQQTNIL